MHILSQKIEVTTAIILTLFHVNEVNSLQFASSIDPCSSTAGELKQGQYWNNDFIPYTLADDLSKNMSLTIQQTIYEIETTTCLRYIPRTNQNDYVLIQHNLRCCSHKGRVGVGIHYLYVHESCTGDVEQFNNVIASSGLVDRELKAAAYECGCGGSFYIDHTSHGIVNSPGYPLDYASSALCFWKFWISNGTTLELEILDFELESEVDCGYDSLEFIKQTQFGETESNFKHCGVLNYQKLNFSAGALSLKFSSDLDFELRGFSIKYKAYKDENSSAMCSQFNGGCAQQCISDANGIKLRCACDPGYSLSSDERKCEDVNECLKGKGGCNQRCRNTEGSYYCHCSWQYGLSKNDNHTCQACGGELSSKHGEFYSPGYSSSELLNLQSCQWTINLLPNHVLKVIISNLSIPVSERCMDNYLKPQHGSFRFKRRICGNFARIQYIIKEVNAAHKTYFRFRSGRSRFQNYTGFHLAYEQVPITQTTQEELDTVYVNNIEIPYGANNWLSSP